MQQLEILTCTVNKLIALHWLVHNLTGNCSSYTCSKKETLHNIGLKDNKNYNPGQLPLLGLCLRKVKEQVPFAALVLQSVHLLASPSPTLPGARQTNQQGIHQPSNQRTEMKNKAERMWTERKQRKRGPGLRMQWAKKKKEHFLKGGHSHA